MLGNAVSRAYPIFPDTVHMPVPGSLSRTPLRIQGPKLIFVFRQFQEGPRATGPFHWAWPRTYVGLGISVPYISLPLIHTRLPGRIKELVEPFDLGDLIAWDPRLWFLINVHLKRRAVSRRQVQLPLLPSGSWTEAARRLVTFGIRRAVRKSCPFIAWLNVSSPSPPPLFNSINSLLHNILSFFTSPLIFHAYSLPTKFLCAYLLAQCSFPP